MKTTLNQLRAHSPCREGWVKLLKTLGKTKADDEPVTILQILDSNGFEDALWCLRAVEGLDKEIRLYAVWCAKQVQHLLTGEKSLKVLDVAEAFANGTATQAELEAAEQAAGAVAGAAWAAQSAAAACAAQSAWAAGSVAGAAAGAAAGAEAGAAVVKAQETELRRLCNELEKEME